MVYELDVAIGDELEPMYKTREHEERFRRDNEARIEKWKAAGLLTKDSIMARVTETVQECLWGEEPTFFRSVCDNLVNASSSPYIEQEAFVSFISSLFPSAFDCRESSSLLFKATKYLATLPFTAQSPGSLTSEGLLRAVTMVAKDPLSRGSAASCWVLSRTRTQRDVRRIIFQSLASPGSPHTSGAAHCKSYLQDDLKEDLEATGGHNSSWFIDVSHENPGLTDVLDALTATQPDQDPPQITVARAVLRPIAEGLSPPIVNLEELQITPSNLSALLKILLAMSLEAPGSTTEQHKEWNARLENAAGCMLAAFTGKNESTGISWEAFNHVILKTMPFLFRNLTSLFECFLRPPQHIAPPPAEPATPDPSIILSDPILCQLAFFLPESLPYFKLQILHNIKGKTNLSATGIKWQAPSLFIVSGITNDESKSSLILGAFLPKPQENDGLTNSLHSNDTIMLFQAAPVHHVQRGNGVYGKVQDNSWMRFHCNEGLMLEISGDWQKGVLLKDGVGVGFDVTGTEIWGFGDSTKC